MQIKREIKITYTWYNDAVEEASPEQIEQLEEDAREHIFQMMSSGFTSGDLFTHFIDETECYGGWSIDETNVDGP